MVSDYWHHYYYQVVNVNGLKYGHREGCPFASKCRLHICRAGLHSHVISAINITQSREHVPEFIPAKFEVFERQQARGIRVSRSLQVAVVENTTDGRLPDV
jgi:hypothetical protein